MKKIMCLLCVMVLLVGCHKAKESVQVQTTQDSSSMDSFDDTYYKILDQGGSELREDFYLDFGTSHDFQTIGRGLQILSAEYFSTSDHYMSEGQYMTPELTTQLLRRSKDKSEYPYSIQPEKGETIAGVFEPIMVSSIQEQDYYVKNGTGYTLKGISFAIIIDPTDSKGATLNSPMSDNVISEFGKRIIPTFYKFITEYEDFEKIKNLPIFVTVYQATTSSESTINGHYILQSYCNGEVGAIKNVNQKTVIFASSDAKSIDSTTAADFDIVKSNLKEAATEAAGLVGTAQYQDGKIQSMVIEANLNVKTYTELLYLTSLIADNIESKFTYDFDIKVLVNSQDSLQAIIIKESGKDATSHILY